jgi:hypothetical protein
MFAPPSFLSWHRKIASAALVAVFFVSFVTPEDGNASTAAERRLALINAPHESVAVGKKVRAHWVRQIIFPGDKKSREEAVALKSQYEKCVQTAPLGATVKPVYEWPERSSFVIKDFYLSEDGLVLEYERSVSYMVAPTADMGCQLLESTQFDPRGRLLSVKGACSFDMSTKAASGECHSQALSRSTRFALSKVGNDRPAVPGAVLGIYTVTDEVRQVAGFPCRVVKARLGEHLISHCFAKIGSFKGYHAGAPRPDDAVALSLEDLQKDLKGPFYEGRAQKVAPDLLVSSEIFFPFRAAGFVVDESSANRDDHLLENDQGEVDE